VLPGFGHTAGKALALHGDVDGIAFTGSTATGRAIMQYAGQSNLKRVSLECGGKSPNVIMGDWQDLRRAARASAYAIFFNQGEMCSAGSRLIVEESVKDRVLEKIFAVGKKLAPGDPLDPKTGLGAMVDETQTKRVLGYIDAGQKEGANLVFGGKRVKTETGGCYIEPTVFDGVKNSMKIAQEEIFGPVLSTITFKDADEAVRIGNDTSYGLAAAVWTKDITKAFRASRALRAGVVWVNCFDNGHISSPFGGFKQSGFGRDKSLHAMDKYTELKTTWVNIGA
jgi:acyl-CoA reductase-like NAD-dependent aldehyde dehydrogenase